MKKVAFIFPGQGSQSVGMGKDFFENNDIAKDMISKASTRLGINFEELLFTENDNLGKTEFTQPAILLVSSIANAIFKDKCDIQADFVLGKWSKEEQETLPQVIKTAAETTKAFATIGLKFTMEKFNNKNNGK